MSALQDNEKEEKEKCCVESCRVWGRVQGVMFRQTLMRGAQRRGLQAAASNDADDRSAVTLTLAGDPQRVRELVSSLCSGRLQFCEKGEGETCVCAVLLSFLLPFFRPHPCFFFAGAINSWGARVARAVRLDAVVPLAAHQVTTANVDSFHWRSGVEMYL